MRRFSSLIYLVVFFLAVLSGGCGSRGNRISAQPWKLQGPFNSLTFDRDPDSGCRTGKYQRQACAGFDFRRSASANGIRKKQFTSFELYEQEGGNKSEVVFKSYLEEDERTAASSTGRSLPDTGISGKELPVSTASEEEKFWYLDLGFRMGITRLGGTEEKLDKRLNDPMKLDVFGVFEKPHTPIDRKSELGLNTFFLGIGRKESSWLTWNVYFGGGIGKDRDHQRWLNHNLDVRFDYLAYYTGFTVDIYPWGTSRRGRYDNFLEHLRASRPYYVTGIEIGYVRARGWGDYKIAPIRVYHDSQRIEDWLFSGIVGLGWEIPLDNHWAFNLQTHYTFHAYRPEEYNGWNITYALRYKFLIGFLHVFYGLRSPNVRNRKRK